MEKSNEAFKFEIANIRNSTENMWDLRPDEKENNKLA